MYDNILMANKKNQWIEGTTARWDGYMEVQPRPDPLTDVYTFSKRARSSSSGAPGHEPGAPLGVLRRGRGSDG